MEQQPLFSEGCHDAYGVRNLQRYLAGPGLPCSPLLHIRLVTLTSDPPDQQRPCAPNQKVDSGPTEVVARPLPTCPLFIHHRARRVWHLGFPGKFQLVPLGSLASDSDPLTPFPDLHLTSFCLRPNSCNKSLYPRVILLALLPD